MNKIVIYDFETTGLTKEDHPVQIVCKTVFENGDEENYQKYVKPQVPINPFAQSVHGLSEKFLNKNGIDLSDAVRDMKNIFSGAKTIVGYNILGFDNVMLNRLMANYHLDFTITDSMCYDVYGAFKADYMGIEPNGNYKSIGEFHRSVMGRRANGISFKLKNAVEHYAIPKGAFHDAKYDVDATYLIFSIISGFFPEQLKNRE